VANVSRVWQNRPFARTIGASYDWAMERQAVARRFGRLLMGADVNRVYRAMGVIAEIPDGSAILDVPCGGGSRCVNCEMLNRFGTSAWTSRRPCWSKPAAGSPTLSSPVRGGHADLRDFSVRSCQLCTSAADF
jgi:hypothetical protein